MKQVTNSIVTTCQAHPAGTKAHDHIYCVHSYDWMENDMVFESVGSAFSRSSGFSHADQDVHPLLVAHRHHVHFESV